MDRENERAAGRFWQLCGYIGEMNSTSTIHPAADQINRLKAYVKQLKHEVEERDEADDPLDHGSLTAAERNR